MWFKPLKINENKDKQNICKLNIQHLIPKYNLIDHKFNLHFVKYKC